MKTPSRRPRPRSTPAPNRDRRRLERNSTVLWTIAPPGILLHNYQTRQFVELDGLGYRIWAFLDGGRDVDEVVERCRELTQRSRSERRIREVVEMLFANGFVAERPHV